MPLIKITRGKSNLVRSSGNISLSKVQYQCDDQPGKVKYESSLHISCRMQQIAILQELNHKMSVCCDVIDKISTHKKGGGLGYTIEYKT